MLIPFTILASFLAIAALVHVILRYRLGLAQRCDLRDGAEYERGYADGMERAACLLEVGEGAYTSNVYTPAPAELARAIRAASPAHNRKA